MSNIIYEHFKGNRYRLVGVATHTETHEAMVVYQALYGDCELWVRPASMFEEMVEHNGQIIPRFRRVTG
jgi:cyclomaltodextrinase